MKWPLAALAISYLIFFGCLAATLGELPARMATHFDIAGRPNGWMDRFTFLAFTIGLAVGLPAFMVAMTAISGRVPVSFVNIPHRAYWLAPERRGETIAILLRFVVALGAVVVVFLAGLHLLVVRANASLTSPHLDGVGIAVLSGGMLAATIVWVVLLKRRFAR